MSWIRTLRSAISIADIVVVTSISLVLFVVVNLAFVYFSPSIVHKLPLDIVRGISSCYRTFYHFDLSELSDNSKLELVFGDSYSEGAGDEYLDGKNDFGIFRKLKKTTDREFVVYGRSGYGNSSTVKEAINCEPLLNRYTSLSYKRNQIERITFVFHEGNDLLDNLKEINRNDPPFSLKLWFFLPLVEYAYYKITESGSGNFQEHKIAQESKIGTGYTADLSVTASGIEIPGAPQSAPLDLKPDELLMAIDVLDNSLTSLKRIYPDAQLMFIYLPSVAGSYKFSAPLSLLSSNGKSIYSRSGDEHDNQSREIRDVINNMVVEAGWGLCDATERLQAISSQGIALHGPRDWKHFNRNGYQSVVDSYLKCS